MDLTPTAPSLRGKRVCCHLDEAVCGLAGSADRDTGVPGGGLGWGDETGRESRLQSELPDRLKPNLTVFCAVPELRVKNRVSVFGFPSVYSSAEIVSQ